MKKILLALINFFVKWYTKEIPQAIAIDEALPPPVPSIPTNIMVKPQNRIEGLAKALATYEKVNISLNNPGGLRSSPFQNGFIIQEKTGKKLATFATYEDGWEALIHQITIVCNGTSPAYTKAAKELGISNCGDLMLDQFMGIYAPRYENELNEYLAFVRNRTGLQRSVKMKELL